MEKTLYDIHQDLTGSKGHSESFNSLSHCIDHMRTLFENIRPDKVQQVDQRVFTVETMDPQT